MDTMWQAKNTAQVNVSKSPIFIYIDPSSVRKDIPIKHRKVAIILYELGFSFETNQYIKGTITTFVPVKNACLLAVVYIRPIVCVENARKRKVPTISPVFK